MMKTVLAGIGLLAIATTIAVAAPAHLSPAVVDAVDEGARPYRLMVSSGDLDLARREGRRELGNRINRAVGRICGSSAPMNLHERRLEMICRTTSWNSARGAVTAAVIRARHTASAPAVALLAATDPRGIRLPVSQPAVATLPADTLTSEEQGDIFRFACSRAR